MLFQPYTKVEGTDGDKNKSLLDYEILITVVKILKIQAKVPQKNWGYDLIPETKGRSFGYQILFTENSCMVWNDTLFCLYDMKTVRFPEITLENQII